MAAGRKTGKLTAPCCPNCGRFMDKIEAWVCSSTGCGHKTVRYL